MKTIFALVCGIATSMALFAEVTTDCYWHWMNGNVSKEGITADLEYMKAGGIEAAMIFDVGIGVKRGKVDYASAEWKDCVAWASREAERLGIELSLHNSPGYSACGGPWIAPEESMKQLVWIVESSKREGALTGGSGVPPLQENGVVQIFNKRRDAASPSHVRFSCFEKRRDAASPSHDCCSKHGFYREIARYPLATADETIDIDKRLEKGESVEFALDCEKEVSALNVWSGEREKPLDPFDGPRDYGCTLKVEAFDGAAWHAVGDVRCPTFRSFTGALRTARNLCADEQACRACYELRREKSLRPFPTAPKIFFHQCLRSSGAISG